jgi:hypothetical protein
MGFGDDSLKSRPPPWRWGLQVCALLDRFPMGRRVPLLASVVQAL